MILILATALLLIAACSEAGDSEPADGAPQDQNPAGDTQQQDGQAEGSGSEPAESARSKPAPGAEAEAGAGAEEAAGSEQDPDGGTAGKDEEKKMDIKEAVNNITVNTQSSIRIEGPKIIYIDPYKRTEAPHDADLILITHAHYDHFDEPSLRNVANGDTIVICPLSMKNDVARLGIGRSMLTAEAGSTVRPGGESYGVTVEAVPSYNLNKQFHPKKNGWLGYIITMDGVRYYAAGDTDALPELEKVKCDIAMVPAGGTFTMTAKEAAGLVNKIRPEYAIPIHYGTIVGTAADADTFKAAADSSIKVVTRVADAK